MDNTADIVQKLPVRTLIESCREESGTNIAVSIPDDGFNRNGLQQPDVTRAGMVHRRGIPFQLLMTLRVGALILALTAAFLWFVLDRVQQRVEQSGRENFELLASKVFGDIDGLMQSHLHYLDTVSRLLPALGDLFSESSRRALAASFLQRSGPNALVVIWPNGEQLYFLKEDVEAPGGTAYTVGHMRKLDSQSGTIDISYHATDDVVIARRQIPVSPYLGSTEAYEGAMRSGHYFASTVRPIPGRESLRITLAVKAAGDRSVNFVTPLEQVDELLAGVALSANGAVVLVDDQQRVVAMHTRGERWQHLSAGTPRLQSISQIGDPLFAAAAHATAQLVEDQTSLVDLAGQPFLLAWHDMLRIPGTQYRLLLMAPLDDLSQIAGGARLDAWMVVLAGLALVLPLSWISSGAMARVLQNLVSDSQRIGRMDFAADDAPIRSSVREVQALGEAHEVMRGALAGRTLALQRVSGHLERLVDIGIYLSAQTDRKVLLDRVLDAAREMTGAQLGVLLLRDGEDRLRPVAAMGMLKLESLFTLDLNRPERARESLAMRTVLSGTTQVVDNLTADQREETGNLRRLEKLLAKKIRTAASLLLKTEGQSVVGIMMVFNATDPDSGALSPFTGAQLTYLEALAAQAAVVVERQKLISSQDQLLDTLVRTLGDAIDAKSEYTGRHCARVPELAMMLAREAHNATDGRLADFAFRNEDEWREFRTGAWLHDCGKITTPEHVLDKATKLETVYNRLHEIRTRFEVLLRDVRIEALQAQLDGRMDVAAARQFCRQREQVLQEDFAFVASCNIGSEKMADEDRDRIRRIAQKRWMRHFDDRLGISLFEAELHQSYSDHALPVAEALIGDKPWHLVPRTAEQRSTLTEGFRMVVPEHLYNHGELYNLCVERGTLNEEERFKVNEHIIHTLRMLEGAHFPPHLRRVPEYAGTHHESMDGSGYPRGLAADQLSIPARIMAIADIFEALTAADRPYKPAKPLSESLRILQRLKNKGHIDPDLFALFLQNGVYRRYAERFLSPEQIDVDDIASYLA